MLKTRLPFLLMFMSGAILIVLALSGISGLWIIVSGVFWLVTSLWAFFSVALPAKVAQIGIEMLNSQEYNHRLAKVGEPGADTVVSLYNKLISRLAEERRRVKETNNFLDLLLSVSPQGVVIMDFDNKIMYANSAFRRMTGAKEPLGLTVDELQGELSEFISTLPPGESHVLRMSDTEIYRCRRDYFMENGFRKPFVIIDALTDEIRKAEKEAYSMIIRVISHEVNNSIGGIRSFLEIIASSPTVEVELREVAEGCRHRCDTLRSFIEGYADIVKMNEPELERFDINALLERMRPFLTTLCGHVMLNYVLTPGCLYISADRGFMEQIVVNVVKNAVESIGDNHNGVITVRTLSDKGASLQIDDSGSGLSAEDSKNIFKPFYSTKRNNQGLGLTFVAEALRRQKCCFGLKTIKQGLTRFYVNFNR